MHIQVLLTAASFVLGFYCLYDTCSTALFKTTWVSWHQKG